MVLRNMYRSLIGIYMFAAGLSAKERARRHNILPLTLGPHGTMFKDVVESLDGLHKLDRGIEVDWYDGQKMLVFGFVLGFLSKLMGLAVNDLLQIRDGTFVIFLQRNEAIWPLTLLRGQVLFPTITTTPTSPAPYI